MERNNFTSTYRNLGQNQAHVRDLLRLCKGERERETERKSEREKEGGREMQKQR